MSASSRALIAPRCCPALFKGRLRVSGASLAAPALPGRFDGALAPCTERRSARSARIRSCSHAGAHFDRKASPCGPCTPLMSTRWLQDGCQTPPSASGATLRRCRAARRRRVAAASGGAGDVRWQPSAAVARCAVKLVGLHRVCGPSAVLIREESHQLAPSRAARHRPTGAHARASRVGGIRRKALAAPHAPACRPSPRCSSNPCIDAYPRLPRLTSRAWIAMEQRAYAWRHGAAAVQPACQASCPCWAGRRSGQIQGQEQRRHAQGAPPPARFGAASMEAPTVNRAEQAWNSCASSSASLTSEPSLLLARLLVCKRSDQANQPPAPALRYRPIRRVFEAPGLQPKHADRDAPHVAAQPGPAKASPLGNGCPGCPSARCLLCQARDACLVKGSPQRERISCRWGGRRRAGCRLPQLASPDSNPPRRSARARATRCLPRLLPCSTRGRRLRLTPQCRVPGFQPRRPGPPGAAAVEAVPGAAPLRQHPGGNGSGDGAAVRFGFPKGSLQKATEDLFARAGYQAGPGCRAGGGRRAGCGAAGRRPPPARAARCPMPDGWRTPLCCAPRLLAASSLTHAGHEQRALLLLPIQSLVADQPPRPSLPASRQVKISERGYFPKVNDDGLSMVLFRSQEIRCGQGWRGD